jgi:hypothetical protein
VNYKDAAIHLEALVKAAEAHELSAAEFEEKIELIRLSLVRHAAHYVQSQRTVTYTFHRLVNYVRSDFKSADRASIRMDLARLSMADAFEPKEPKR